MNKIIISKKQIAKLGWENTLDLLFLNGFFNNYYELHFHDEIHFIKEL